MKTCILTVPSKKTEDVNWTKPINNYLLSIYGSTTDYQHDLATFAKLRLDICAGVHGDATGLKIYYKYYSLLELLDLRVPFDTLNKHKKISFTWFDSFNPHMSYKQYSLPFEKAGILYNTVSVLSDSALKKYISNEGDSDESIKEALVMLQQAAGVLQFLRENFLHAPSKDLNRATTTFLIELMLAQAQELFALKVINGDTAQTKNSLIAKLCKSASNHYAECHKLVKHLAKSERDAFDAAMGSSKEFSVSEAGLEEFLDSDYDPDKNGNEDGEEDEGEDSSNDDDKVTLVPPHWIAIVEFKRLYYSSLSLYFQGLQCEAQKKFGDAIAYLTKSLDVLNEISSAILKQTASSKVSNAYEVLDNYKYQKDAIGIKLGEMEKDNDFIYHDIIPLKVTLPEIKAMDGVKPIPITQNTTFNDINDYNYNNFFTNVVPMNIHELLSLYSEEKSQFLRNELDLCDVSNEELNSVMEYLNMPKSVVSLKEIIADSLSLLTSLTHEVTPQIPMVLVQISQEIASAFHDDTTNRAEIGRLRDQIYSIIQKCEQRAVEDKDDLIKLKRSFIEASNRDHDLFNLISEGDRALYSTLGKGPQSLEFKNLFSGKNDDANKRGEAGPSLLDIDDSSQEETTQRQIRNIEEILHDLHSIKANKTKVIDNLKKEILNDDISDILILNTKVKSVNEIKTIIFSQELTKFDKYTKELDALISKQRLLLDSLVEKWKVLTNNPEVKEIQSSSVFRKQVLQHQEERIMALYPKWKRYSNGLSKGVAFYRNVASYAQNLLQKFEDERDVQQRFGDMNLGHSKYGAPVQQLRKPSYPNQQQQTQGHQGLETYMPPQHSGYQNKSAYAPPQFSGPSKHAPFTSDGYNGPPQLPPKAPRQALQTLISLQAAQHPSQDDGLIYSQPSTYQPNMYNFFSRD
jgi:programmed cell death 6-interacting protein